jgi:flagellar basal-body rod protein FlgC
MDYRSIFQVSASGMDLEKLRLDTAALNLANMDTSVPAGAAPFKPLRVVGQAVAPSFGQWMEMQGAAGAGGVENVGGVALAAVGPTDATARIVHDPAHPHADARGDVRYPGVDHTAEMLNIMTALRAYEANVAAIGAAKSMATHALEIGDRT